MLWLVQHEGFTRYPPDHNTWCTAVPLQQMFFNHDFGNAFVSSSSIHGYISFLIQTLRCGGICFPHWCPNHECQNILTPKIKFLSVQRFNRSGFPLKSRELLSVFFVPSFGVLLSDGALQGSCRTTPVSAWLVPPCRPFRPFGTGQPYFGGLASHGYLPPWAPFDSGSVSWTACSHR